MPLKKTCTIGCLFVCAALAQTEGDLRAKVATIHYPPIARQARIQGDVRIDANSGVATLVSGHPLFAPLAIENAKALGSIQGQTKFEITYHFVLVDTTVPTLATVKRGNAFERAILRVLRMKTEEVVRTYPCEGGVVPANDIKTEGAKIEIWVYGQLIRCIQTNRATLVAKG